MHAAKEVRKDVCNAWSVQHIRKENRFSQLQRDLACNHTLCRRVGTHLDEQGEGSDVVPPNLEHHVLVMDELLPQAQSNQN